MKHTPDIASNKIILNRFRWNEQAAKMISTMFLNFRRSVVKIDIDSFVDVTDVS